MKQLSFLRVEFERKKRVTRRDRFLAKMEALTPWAELVEVIPPHYPKDLRGRPRTEVDWMLRLYAIQQRDELSDEGAEDVVNDSQAVCGFVGIDLPRKSVTDTMTLLQFSGLLEVHDLTRKLFDTIIAGQSADGRMMRERAIIADATIIAVPPSVKNQDNARDRRFTRPRTVSSGLRVEGSNRYRSRERTGLHDSEHRRQCWRRPRIEY